MHDLGVRGGGEPFVHRAALVGLVMAKADPPQLLDRKDLLNRRANDRKHAPEPGVEEQGLVA